MAPAEFLDMVNRFDEETKDNIQKILYGNEERIKASNIKRNNRFVGATPPINKDSNPLCDEICNNRAPDL